jgi:hypothetical protein
MRFGGTSILPGGRAIAPAGKAYKTGAGSFALAVNSKGTTVVTVSAGLNRSILTAVTRDKEGWHPNQIESEETGRRIVSAGVAFEDDNDVYFAEGETGRVLLVDSRSGKVKQTYDLNQASFAEATRVTSLMTPRRSACSCWTRRMRGWRSSIPAPSGLPLTHAWSGFRLPSLSLRAESVCMSQAAVRTPSPWWMYRRPPIPRSSRSSHRQEPGRNICHGGSRFCFKQSQRFCFDH